jgi:hypothetical protein
MKPKLVTAALAAALCFAFSASSAHAATMGVIAQTGGSQGDSCVGGHASSTSQGSQPQAVTFTCISVRGEGVGTSHANASFGTVGAFANATSFAGVNLGSLSTVDINASANYSDSSAVFSGFGNFATVSLNVNFHATTTANGGTAMVNAVASIGGVPAASCFQINSGGGGCSSHTIQVPLNQAVMISMGITAIASANANGQLQDFFATADGGDTFSFAIGGPVFNLPDGVTFNDPEAFIFNNIYSPPGSVTATPLPGALPLFATGLGALGLLGWRRKRKLAA